MKAFLGRFQPFHRGHLSVVEGLDDFIIAVGSASKSRTEDNPLSFEERKRLIEACVDTEVVGLEDTGKTPEGNREWGEKLEGLGADVIVSGNDLVKRIVRDYTDLGLEEPEMLQQSIYSGTEIRRRIRSGEEWRYLVPDCAANLLEEDLSVIRESGPSHEFEPGWN